MQQFKQSPINIITTQLSQLPQSVDFHYYREQFNVVNTGLNISLVPVKPTSYFFKNNLRYTLSEIHFHRPSEHHVDYQNFDMEVHLVHHGQNSVVVYSVLLNICEEGNDFGQPFSSIGEMIEIDLSSLVATVCWDYHGSLTTSPFDEAVIWLINQHPQTICQEQANLLNNYYPHNNRCLQPLNDRDVYTIFAEKK